MSAGIACIGAGTVGAVAALLLARAQPQATLTVYDAGWPPAGDRTFVIGGRTWQRLVAAGVISPSAIRSRPLREVRTNFAGCFGGVVLGAPDCAVDEFARTVGERDLRAALHERLAATANVELVMGAEVTALAPSGEVTWQSAGPSQHARHDLVVATGLAENLLTTCGFVFDKSAYDQLALVCTITARTSPGTTAHERLLDTGAVTSVPRHDGWGHILLLARGTAHELAALDDASYLAEMATRGWLPEAIHGVARDRCVHTPAMRLARPAGLGRVALLGPAGCMLNPVGAQELNLALRDALALAAMVKATTDLSDVAVGFSAARQSAREQVARLTDRLARLIRCRLPGKLPVLGLGATLAGLVPAARALALGRMTLRGD